MLGKTDEEQLAYAASEGRCIVTCDERDYRRMATQWLEEDRSYAGIIIIPFEVKPYIQAAVTRALHRYALLYPNGLPENTVMYLALE
jgi:hypothetical protein